MPNLNLIKKYNRVHLVGIGGVSMSGIAEILNNFDIYVTGSDATKSIITDKLIEHGLDITIGHNFENIAKADCVIYSAAVKQDDPELIKAKELNIPIIERCDFLGLLTKAFQNTIGISGTHGKTTTTSLVSLCFIEANLDPNIQVGALLKQINGNYRIGNSEHFIIEACEYVESFLKFSPKAEIVLDIDNDHLDYFKNLDNVKNAFIKYVKLLPDNGLLVVNGDDKNCLDLLKYTKAKTLTYSITNETSDFYAKNIVFDEIGFPEFDVYCKNNFYAKIKLSIPGIHNVSNSLACISLCNEYGIDKKYIISALKKFTGADRRFQYVGEMNSAKIFDDYGHHPTEIVATAKALMNKKYNKSWVVFQPHTYSRTKTLLTEFANALLYFDNIIVTDIYAAREDNTYGISSKDLADAISNLGKKAEYISDFNNIATYLKNNVNKDDIIITLGAGTITDLGSMLLHR